MPDLEQRGELLKCGHAIMQEAKTTRDSRSNKVAAGFLHDLRPRFARARCYQWQTESSRYRVLGYVGKTAYFNCMVVLEYIENKSSSLH
jgi:hypothetical protein